MSLPVGVFAIMPVSRQHTGRVVIHRVVPPPPGIGLPTDAAGVSGCNSPVVLCSADLVSNTMSPPDPVSSTTDGPASPMASQRGTPSPLSYDGSSSSDDQDLEQGDMIDPTYLSATPEAAGSSPPTPGRAETSTPFADEGPAPLLPSNSPIPSTPPGGPHTIASISDTPPTYSAAAASLAAWPTPIIPRGPSPPASSCGVSLPGPHAVPSGIQSTYPMLTQCLTGQPITTPRPVPPLPPPPSVLPNVLPPYHAPSSIMFPPPPPPPPPHPCPLCPLPPSPSLSLMQYLGIPLHGVPVGVPLYSAAPGTTPTDTLYPEYLTDAGYGSGPYCPTTSPITTSDTSASSASQSGNSMSSIPSLESVSSESLPSLEGDPQRAHLLRFPTELMETEPLSK